MLRAALKELNAHFIKYPKDYNLVTFLDNHDMNRFLFECSNDREKLKTAAKIQFEFDQPAIIYYGTETGMTHARSVFEDIPHADIEARQPMSWDDRDDDLFDFYKDLILEKANKSSIIRLDKK